MRKIFVLALAAFCLGTTMQAQETTDVPKDILADPELQPLSPTYLDGVFAEGGWGSNWFITAQGGVNLFVGNPRGCGDASDRTTPSLSITAGKWFTPYIGGRITYQGVKMNGLNWNGTEIETSTFAAVHADFLYNISYHLRHDMEVLPNWDLIPYLGCGVIKNYGVGNLPFTMNMGIIGRYRLSRRLHLTAELSGLTTLRTIDAIGPDRLFADNMYHATVGLSYTIGKVGWKNVIDAKPYIAQNDILITKVHGLHEENMKLNKKVNHQEAALREMRKILEIEGLIKKYKLMSSDDDEMRASCANRNSYSGLNSLRERLRNRQSGDTDYNSTDYRPITNIEAGDSLTMEQKIYISQVNQGKACIGTPVMFFFRIRTADLVNSSQLANLKAIAKLMNEHGLYAKVTGTADSQTGSPELNQRLSERRADYIAKQLRKLGVAEDHVITVNMGGVDTFENAEDNRNTSVMLFMKN